MKHGPITDPELLGLLREVSSDPKSRLMKLATQGDTPVGLRERPISEGEPFLTRAERHLIREHREQVAQLLFEAAKRACLEASQLETGLYLGSFAGWTPVVARHETMRERELLLRLTPFDSDAVRSLEQLAETPKEVEDQYGHSCAVASFHLVARDSVRNLIGLACFARGRRVEGFKAWDEILAHQSSGWYRSVAFQNKAYERAEEGLLKESKDLYLEAQRVQPSRPEPLVGLLSICLRSADQKGALSAASALSELDAEPCLREHMEVLTSRLRTGRFSVSSEASEFSKRIIDRLPSSVASVARIYAQHAKGGS